LQVGNPYLTPRIKLSGLVETGHTIRSSRRIMLIACGTSYHACLASRQTLEDMCQVGRREEDDRQRGRG
jgi:glucosamine--fructose-6-phosphate aminotransferase (isomerizing)